MEAAYYIAKKEVLKMKKDMSKAGLYIGIGAGIVLFALSGLLPGSFIGGSIGVNLSKSLFGGVVESSLLPRLIVGISMFSGILAAGLCLLIFTSSLGWLTGYSIGYVIDALNSSRTADMVKNEAAVDSH
jgi:hypothetical protein